MMMRIYYNSYSSFYFHYSNRKDITFMCMSDIKLSNNIAFLFLDEVCDTFFETFDNEAIYNSISYSLNLQFSNVIEKKLDYYNKNIDKFTEEVDLNSSVVTIGGEKINLIVRKSTMIKESDISYLNNVSNLDYKI